MQITTQHLTKRFQGVTAVDDLSITLESGQLIALLGPSGCGKTTILNMLSGILPVSGGTVRFDDTDVTSLPPEKRGVGLVFQNYALYPHMTVLQNICFPMEIKRIPKEQRLRRAAELAELVHIAPLMKRKPSELSGGQQQRVAIARALAKDPDVLLLDEPLSNLDAKLRVEMREEIRRIQREQKITTIFVTHDQEEASSIADQIVLLNGGVLQQQDTARKLYEEPKNFFVADFLGAPAINKLHARVRGEGIVLDQSEIYVPIPAAGELQDGLAVILAVRAESVDAMPQKPLCAAYVMERYSMGKDELTLLRLGEGQQIRGFIPSELTVREGMDLPIGLKARGVFLFDANSGERYA